MVSYNGALDMVLPLCIGPMYRRDTSARYRTSRYVASRGHGVRARAHTARRAEPKTMFDVRRKLRAALAANGYVDHGTAGAHERAAGTGSFPAGRSARRGMRRGHGDTAGSCQLAADECARLRPAGGSACSLFSGWGACPGAGGWGR